MRIGQTVTVKTNATNSDLQRAIEAAIPAAVKQMKQRSHEFKGRTEIESCKKIFDYLKNNIQYKADGNDQQVRVPSGLIRTRQGDCKSYSVFTSAVLTNLGIPHKLVYASYNPNDNTPTHIYVMTDKGCIIDAVYGKFNAEKKAAYKKYKDMNISYISGVRGHRARRIGSMGKYGTGGACGIGGIDTGETWAKNLGLWDKISNSDKLSFFANLALPPAIIGREIVKALLRKNAGGMANSLANIYNIARANNATPEFTKYRSIEMQWFVKGGNPDELRVAFQEGNTKTPTGAYFNQLLQKRASGQSVTVPQWLQGAISALFGKKYDPSTGQITGGVGIGADPATDTAAVVASAPWWAVMVSGIVTTLGLAYITKGATPAPGDPTTNTDTGSGTDQNTPPATSSALLPILLIGGAAAAYYFIIKKK